MATEHPKPWCDAICFKCDDYMMPGLPLRLLQFNHWRANSSPSLSFLSISERAWLVGQGASESPRSLPSHLWDCKHIHLFSIFSIAGEGSRSQTPRPHACVVSSWPTTKPCHQPSAVFQDRDTGSVVCVILWDWGRDESIHGVWGRDLWTQRVRTTFWIKFFWVIQNSYDLDVLFSILYYSKQAGEDFSRF